MSSTPEQFLDFSVLAHNNAEGHEFNYRNAASRAYYAAFHCCNAEIYRCNSPGDDSLLGSHDQLYARFIALPLSPVANILKSMTYIAIVMKTVRRKADYYLEDSFTFDESAQQIKEAQVVVRKWKELQNL